MASALFTLAKDKILEGELDLVDHTINAILVVVGDGASGASGGSGASGEYVVDIDTDEFLEDVDPGAILSTETLTNTSVSGGVFDADDAVFTDVSGDPFAAIILYRDVTDETDSPLIAYIETVEVQPIGTDITVSWSDGDSKIFRLI